MIKIHNYGHSLYSHYHEIVVDDLPGAGGGFSWAVKFIPFADGCPDADIEEIRALKKQRNAMSEDAKEERTLNRATLAAKLEALLARHATASAGVPIAISGKRATQTEAIVDAHLGARRGLVDFAK